MVVLAQISAQVNLLNAQKLTAKIIKAEYFKSGVDADVFKLSDVDGRHYALKKSRDNFFDNANDINQDDAHLFRQEAEFSKLINGLNIALKSPETIYCHADFLVMEFIDDDGQDVEINDCVNLLSQMHIGTQNISVDLLPISHERHEDIAQALADRMLRRIENLKNYIQVDFTWLNRQMIVDIVQSDENDNCLLHMDFRRNNLLQNDGKIYIIDWANALIGSPLVELARLEVYDEFAKDLQVKYLAQNPHVVLDQMAYNIYMLDTVIMMNLVFLFSAPNAKLAYKFEQKLYRLIEKFT